MRNIFLFLTVFFVFLSVRVAAQPCDPDFSFTVSCNVVTFTPKQTGAGISYKWKFGTVAKDSLVTTQSPVTFTYYVDNTGMQTFDVTLTVKGPNCIEKSMTKQVKITVPSLPVPKLTTPDLTKPFTRCNASVIAYTLKVSNATTTTASNTKYTINWGDGSAVETINVPPGFTTTTHSYSKLGLFPIVETITDLNGCVDSANYRFFNGNDPATAAPSTPANSNKCVTSVVTFPFNKQAKGNDPSTIYICKVDDGSQPVTLLHDTLNFFFIHTFTKGSCDPEFVGKLQQEGIFTITVDAVNACSSQPSSTGIKLSSPGQAKFSVKPKTEDCVGKVFDIVNESDKGHYFDNGCKDDMVAYWSISPNTNYTITAGSLGTYPNTPGSPDGFSVSFSQPGTYEIKLVWDARFSSGCPPVETKRTICVLPKPTSSFTISPSGTKCIPNSNTVTFTNTSNTLKYCGTAKYTWKPIFDSSPCGSTGGFTYLNGKNANSQDIDVRFDKSGTYKIRLKVENICGIDSSEQTITIAEGAKSVIDSIPNFCDGAKITPRLKSTSSACGAAATGWVWSFPGGDPMNYTGETPPEIMYNTPGTYTISVATTNGCGTTTATRTFTVYKSPTIPPNITVIVSPPCKGKTITFSNPSPGNLEYKWSGPNGFMSTKPQPDPIPAVPPGGIYSLTVTDPVSKCTKTQTYNVTVNDLPPVTLSQSGM